MKIVLATYGSRGDVQPMLALALALQSEGHQAILAAPPEKADWAKQLGCPFHPLGKDLTAFIDSLTKVYSIRTLIRALPFLRKEVRTQFRTLPHIIAGADLVIGSSLVGALPSLAEAAGIPYRYIAFTPQILPSGNHPYPAVRYQNLPLWVNRITWRLVTLMDRLNITTIINHYRKTLGLTPINDAWKHILGRYVIVATDPAISKVPADVITPRYVQTGYMHLKQPQQLSPALEQFLARGPAPIYAGFGSMPKWDQINSVTTIVKAARLAGLRTVIGRFWDESSPYDDCEDVHFIGKYPHLDLFGRMAAVIHHGGAGTTASTAICGVPQIIVPHLLDQYYWGNQIYLSKLGPAPIRRSKLKVANLAEAISECVHNTEIKNRAARVSRTIKQSDSLQNNVHFIFDSLEYS